MSKIKENIIKFINRILKKGSTPMIANVVQEDYTKNNTLANLRIHKNYTYQDKIELITNMYSRRLEELSKTEIYKNAIQEIIEFQHQRRVNHGKNDNDVKLSDEALKILNLMKEYGKSIKKVFVDNNINLTHITPVAPEQIEDGELRKSVDRPNMYETERVNAFFASSTPVDGNNPYIARLGPQMGMVLLGKSTYIYGGDGIDVLQDSDGQKHAILKQPNYVYHINSEKFMPVCNLCINPYTHKPVFEFGDEWISDKSVNIFDSNQVRKVEKISDVTSLLKNYIVLCDTKNEGIGMQARHKESHEDAIKYIKEKIKDGSVRNINEETGIKNTNDRTFNLDSEAIEK